LKIISILGAALVAISSPAMAADLIGSSVSFTHVGNGNSFPLSTQTIVNGTSDTAGIAFLPSGNTGYTANLDANSLTVDFFAPPSSLPGRFPIDDNVFINTPPVGLVLTSTTFDFTTLLSSMTITKIGGFNFTKLRVSQYGATGILFDFSGLSYNNNSGFIANFATVSPAPEPATWAMMIVGFGMAGAAVRRRKATRLAPAC
jgi:hypothetical protein